MWRITILALALSSAHADESPVNVNSRYTVESVDLLPQKPKLSRRLSEDLKKIVGDKLNQTLLDSLRDRLRAETHALTVKQRLLKGTKPDLIQVVFEVRRPPARGVDVAVPKLTYYASQGWSGGGDVVLRANSHEGRVGFINDGDELVERFAGVRGSYERRNFAGVLGFRFDIQDYRTQWNERTLALIDGSSEMYRERRVFQPAMTVRLQESLLYTVGATFQNLQMQFPAARTEAAHAVIQTLRFSRRWQVSDVQHTLDAGYSLRAATKTLASDFVYNRHESDARYEFRSGPHSLSFRLGVGTIGGRAPWFDRFVAGNSTRLRGWNKFEIAPTGLNRLVEGSTEYRYRLFHAFYDGGTGWNPGEPRAVRHSLGVGVHSRSGLYASVAFPLRDIGLVPVLIVGLNF